MDNVRKRTISMLKAIGMHAGLQGFGYIVDMVEMLSDEKQKGNNVNEMRFTGLYELTAKKNTTTYTAVERSIRHAVTTTFKKARQNLVESETANIVKLFNSTTYTPNNKDFVYTLLYEVTELHTMPINDKAVTDIMHRIEAEIISIAYYENYCTNCIETAKNLLEIIEKYGDKSKAVQIGNDFEHQTGCIIRYPDRKVTK